VHPHDVPEDPVGQVDAVQHLIRQDAAGTRGRVSGPWPWVVRGEEEPADRADAEVPCRHQLVEPGVRRGETHVVGRVDPHAGPLRRGDDLLGLLGAGRQRLLAHHAHARGDGGHGDRVVAARRSADVHGIRAVQRLGQGADRPHAELACHVLGTAVVGVDADGRPGAEPRVQVQTGYQPRADQCHLELSHGIPRPSASCRTYETPFRLAHSAHQSHNQRG